MLLSSFHPLKAAEPPSRCSPSHLWKIQCFPGVDESTLRVKFGHGTVHSCIFAMRTVGVCVRGREVSGMVVCGVVLQCHQGV